MNEDLDRPMVIRGLEAGATVWVNAAFRRSTGLASGDLAGKAFADWIDAPGREALEAILRSGQEGRFWTGHAVREGAPLTLEVTARHTPEGWTVCGRFHPDDGILDAYAEEFDRGTVAGTLETIARIVEDQNPGYRCSILLKNRDRFARGAGPSLPEEYNAAIDGEEIGPAVGSCGTAIYWNAPVIVEDIQADPLWRQFAEIAENAGVAACWSHPFTNSAGEVLGALALYAPRPEAPTEEQLSGLRAAARMTGLAVERGRVEEALREQRRREAELEEQLRQAAKMEALGVLAGGLAHDFNNLLTTISGNAELALLDLPSEHEVREYLDRIVLTSQRAGDFCSQMLAYAGRGAIRTRRIEVNALLLEVRDLAHVALTKKTSLVFSLHEQPVHVEADENQLLQVALSLVTNAAEAIGEGEGRILVSTRVVELDAAAMSQMYFDASLRPGRFLRLTVADDGSGMDDETLARIFDPFFTTKFTGRGLGLAAVTGILRRHGGAIRVESEPGRGSTFEVFLPAVAAPEPEGAEVQKGAEPRPRAGRVLVVDDEDGPREVFRLALEGGGFSVVEAVDGEDAVRVFAREGGNLDCVLLDLSMPRLSGHEVLQEIRRIRGDVPVVLISGYNEESILDRLDGAPIAAVLRKPVALSVLVETIRNAATPCGLYPMEARDGES